MASIRFLGGTSTVTGSKFLVEAGGGSVLVDCGLFQGPRRLRQRNWESPFRSIDLPDEVLVTHAHIDHTGFLPRLVGHHGFDGPITATAATADLLGVMLPDSARLQEERAEYLNRKQQTRHDPALPLYTSKDAADALRLLRPVPYHQWMPTAVGQARFSFAGHILGSAHIAIETGASRVVFSGDIGRWDIPVLKDPEPPLRAATVVMESTYGDRIHESAGDPNEWLAGIVKRLVERRGVMVIPAFSVGRTQEVLYRLRGLEDAGAIPELPVFLDSPMATDATELYSKHLEEHDLEMRALRREGANPLRPARFAITRSVDESKQLNGLEGPAIIVSASGMATGGRVVHHLKQRLPRRSDMVVFVGYQAVGTRGRSLVDGARRVKIHGRWVPVNAEVTQYGGFSAHADQNELVRWLAEAQGPVDRVVLVHGEADARRALADRLRSELRVDVVTPRQGAVLEI